MQEKASGITLILGTTATSCSAVATFFSQNGQLITVCAALVTCVITVTVGIFAIKSNRKKQKAYEAMIKTNDVEAKLYELECEIAREKLNETNKK